MSRTQRQQRTSCALRCQIVGRGRKPIEGRLISVSRGGLCVVAPMRLEEGDTLQLRLPGKQRGGATVTGLVWNVEKTRGSLARADFWRIGCVVSDPSPSYQRLVEQLEHRSTPPLERRIAMPQSPAVAPRPSRASSPSPSLPTATSASASASASASTNENDLPRSREAVAPPKPDPHPTLPAFRVRLKQAGGPRSRNIAVCARSVAEAESIAREELATTISDIATWELVEVVLAS